MNTKPSADPHESIKNLKVAISGCLTEPLDSEFDAQRHAWNLTVQHQPSLVAEPSSTQDLQAIVRFAAAQRLPITVQTTGHGQPRSCKDGLLIRMSSLRSVEIDAERQIARVGGGALWSDVIEAAYAHGLAPISGSSPGVGVVGYLLGGGYGLLSRKYGLAVDHLISATVVLPDGSIARATTDDNPDLYYAIRGGGGAFGIIAELEFGLVPQANVFGGNVMYDAKHAHAVLQAWSDWSKTAPEEITSALVLMTFPPVPFIPEFLHGRSVVIFAACAVMSPDVAEAALGPMRTLEGAEFDSFRPMPYTDSGSIFNDPVDPLPAMGTGAMLHEFNHDTVDAFLNGMGVIPESPNLMVQIRHIGGAISRVQPEETPVGNRRKAEYLTYFLGIPMPHNPPERIAAHAETCLQALNPWTLARGPLNWVGEANVPAQAIRGVFDDASFERLVATKRRLDPTNLFGTASIGLWLAND